MANGFHGTRDEWLAMEEPIKRLDDRIAAFASKNGMNVWIDTRNAPGRSIEWREGGIDRLIQIYFDRENRTGLSLWVAATLDVKGKRFWKNFLLKRGANPLEYESDLEKYLEEGRRLVGSWQEKDLEPA